MDLATQAASRFGIPAAFDDPGVMLQSARPQVVHLTTPPHTHKSLAIQCLQAGAHVYVEKPFTVDAAEAEEIVAMAEGLGLLVCVGHDQLFDPAWQECRRRVARGDIGDVIHIDALQGYDLDGPFGRLMKEEPDHWIHRLPGGVFQNSISHSLTRILDFMPDSLPRLHACQFSRQSDQPFTSELRVSLFGATCTGTLIFSSAARPIQKIARVLGTRSGVEVDLDARTLATYGAASLPGPFGKLQLSWRSVMESWQNFGTNLGRLCRSDLHFFEGMHTLFERFYSVISTGGQSPVSHTEAIRVTRLMDLIFESSNRPKGLFASARPSSSNVEVGQ
jgi:predicted dehydrogenase